MGIPTKVDSIYAAVRDPGTAELFEDRVRAFRVFVSLTEAQADCYRMALVCAYLHGRSDAIEEQFQKQHRPASL